MKNGWKVGAALVVGAVLAAGLGGCPPGRDNVLESVFQPPTLAVREVSIQEFTPRGVIVLLDVDIANPNRVGATVSRVDYTLEISGRRFSEGAIDAGVEIKPAGVTNARVPVPLAYEDIIAVFLEALGRDTVPFVLSGKVWVKAPIGSIPIPYRHEDEFEVQLPF